MSAFPSHVDVIIVGTGLTNSIIAAACSRIGKTVLHLDENSYYGDYEASFTFQQLLDWIKKNNPDDNHVETVSQELLDKSRMFCLDLAPRFLFSNGSMVELLVNSNVARYHEFKNNIRILCLIGQNEIQVLPCRRNEVFTSPLLSNLADKRRLMKFIETCLKHRENSGEQSEIEENATKPISQYLEERGLKDTLREYIINSIAMIHPSDSTGEACKRIKKFMAATERYGRSPFLFPLYGCGEYPQSFCRMSAVFGGLYCLSTAINEARYLEQTESGAMGPKFSITFGDTEKYTITSDMIVVDQKTAKKLNLLKAKTTNNDGDSEKESRISRAILITKRSIVPQSDDEEADHDDAKSNDLISFLRIPPSNDSNKDIAFLIELNSSALVCPRNLNVIYLWTKSTDNRTAEDDLKPVVNRLFHTESQQSDILWRFYYHQPCRDAGDAKQHGDGQDDIQQKGILVTDGVPSDGLYVTNPAFDDIDYSEIIKEAKRLFEKMCPDQEFLPRAPDPDEIVHTE